MENAGNVYNGEVSPKSKFGIKFIVISILILLLSFVGAFLVGKTFFNSPDAKAGEESGPIYDSPEFTVNIADSNGRRFLMTQFSIEVETKKVLKELDTKLPMFKDKVIMTLSAQTLENLNSVDGKETIKKLLINSINEILLDGKVVNIFFNKFIFQ